jgi:formylglycine-generating enzyme required for sulfatase activity
MKRWVGRIRAFAVILIVSGCVSSGGVRDDSMVALNNTETSIVEVLDAEISAMAMLDAEISATAALGRMDEALSGPLYAGDGGKDIRLAVLAPQLQGAETGDQWLSSYAQGFLHTTLGKYSAMTLFDRQHLDQIIKEQDLAANMRFSDEDFIKIGSLINVQYLLTGSMQKLPSKEFAISLSITEASSGISRASFMQNGTAEAVQDGTLLNAASESLLSQMGIALTETGRRNLTSARYMTARAEAGYARGVAAEASGAAVEALLNFSQAVAFDPSRLEALSRLGSVSSEISGGSVSAHILNDFQARRTWLDAMKEAAAFFNNHPPFEITYDPNLIQIGKTDYEKEQANLAMWISLMPSEAGFGALNALIEGLEKTEMRKDWGFTGWPLLDITPKTPDAVLFPGKRSFSFTVQTGLVNEVGKVIARGNVKLEVGAIGFNAGDTSVSAPKGVFGQVNFPNVNVLDMTPTLTVVIAGVNNLSARQINDTGYMRIAPGDVAQLAASLASFIPVKGGTFTMGSPASEAGREADEGPQHQVTVSGFYMGKYEVTQKEWRDVMGNNPSDFKGNDLPVEQVSWFDAVEYCNRRSVMEGLEPAYTISGHTVTWNRNANGYRLPTEAEWEYAAKGGGKDNPVFIYSGSNSVDAVAWYSSNSGGRTHPVGTKQANSLGLYDMSGNVWEWCWDWYGGYSSGSQTDPLGAATGSTRVVRGGAWSSGVMALRSARRGWTTPSYRYWYNGFRLVRP